MEEFIAAQEHNGMRLDQWLARITDEHISRSRVKSIIEKGHVQLNGTVVSEPKRRVAQGDIATFAVPEAEDANPKGEDIALDILFEDDDLIVINKPVGMVVHPGAGNPTGTLVNALIHHCGDSLSGVGGVKRPGIVHRLDKNTSGVMVVAKHDQAHKHLSAQFADHGRTNNMRRVYSAIVWGAPQTLKLTIETLLGRSGSDRTKQAIVSKTQPDARHAVTHVQVVERYGPTDGSDLQAALVDCTLETGRTHQIRVHMAHIGHPLIGDDTYGAGYRTKAQKLPDIARQAAEGLQRQALHARLLAFEHPKTGELMEFSGELPEDLLKIKHSFSTAWQ